MFVNCLCSRELKWHLGRVELLSRTDRGQHRPDLKRSIGIGGEEPQRDETTETLKEDSAPLARSLSTFLQDGMHPSCDRQTCYNSRGRNIRRQRRERVIMES